MEVPHYGGPPAASATTEVPHYGGPGGLPRRPETAAEQATPAPASGHEAEGFEAATAEEGQRGSERHGGEPQGTDCQEPTGPQDLSQVPVLEREPPLILQPGATGKGYRAIFGTYLESALAVVLEEPYILDATYFRRLAEFAKLLLDYPGVRRLSVRTDSGLWADQAAQHRITQLQAEMARRGVELRVRAVEGLHWRDLYVIGDQFTWRILIDRGIDCLCRGMPNELARCKRVKLEVSKLGVRATAAEALFTGDHEQECARGLPTQLVEQAAMASSLPQLRRKMREIRQLDARQRLGERLDPYQQRKLGREGLIMAAIRFRSSLDAAGRPSPDVQAGACEESHEDAVATDDEELHAALVEVVKEGQRQDPRWLRAWRHFTDTTGFRSPGTYGLLALRRFIQEQGRRVLGAWILPFREALEDVGLGEVPARACGSSPRALRRSSSAGPEWDQRGRDLAMTVDAASRGRSASSIPAWTPSSSARGIGEAWQLVDGLDSSGQTWSCPRCHAMICCSAGLDDFWCSQCPWTSADTMLPRPDRRSAAVRPVSNDHTGACHPARHRGRSGQRTTINEDEQHQMGTSAAAPQAPPRVAAAPQHRLFCATHGRWRRAAAMVDVGGGRHQCRPGQACRLPRTDRQGRGADAASPVPRAASSSCSQAGGPEEDAAGSHGRSRGRSRGLSDHRDSSGASSGESSHAGGSVEPGTQRVRGRTPAPTAARGRQMQADGLRLGATVAVVSPSGCERECAVVGVDRQLVKIHYDGFGAEHDEWLPTHSDRIIKEVVKDVSRFDNVRSRLQRTGAIFLPPLRPDLPAGRISFRSNGREVVLTWPCRPASTDSDGVRSRDLVVRLGPLRVEVGVRGTRPAYAQRLDGRELRLDADESTWQVENGILEVTLAIASWTGEGAAVLLQPRRACFQP